MLKLIAFDWDDVFTLGSTKGYMECYHQALVEVGVYLEPEEERRRIVERWSTPHREKFKTYILKENPELLDKACEAYERNLYGGTFVGAISIINGTNELLERLHKNYKLSIATGMDPKLLKETIMPKFKIPLVFSKIISAYEVEDAGKHKPHPHMLEELMKSQKAKPSETIFVGDARDDVLMARAAHVEPVVVLTGHLNRKEAEKLGVNYIIGDVTKLEKVLAELK